MDSPFFWGPAAKMALGDPVKGSHTKTEFFFSNATSFCNFFNIAWNFLVLSPLPNKISLNISKTESILFKPKMKNMGF